MIFVLCVIMSTNYCTADVLSVFCVLWVFVYIIITVVVGLIVLFRDIKSALVYIVVVELVVTVAVILFIVVFSTDHVIA